VKNLRFTEQQIVYAIKQVEVGVPIAELCRKYGISQQTFYRWRNKYDGLAPSELRRLKELERENTQLKKLVADLSLDKQILQDILARKE
jgi:putative transposase